jgi:predicted O-methyltransferase YrrM
MDRSKIDGWFWDNEGAWYQKTAAQIHNGTILEIGNHHGLSISYIVGTCRKNNNTIYAIDCANHPEFIINLNQWSATSFVHFIQSDSRQAAPRFADQTFDLIFIDGDHSYQGVKADIQAWKDKLKPSGILAGHDYQPGMWSEVCQAVDELLPHRQILPHSRIWYVIPPPIRLNYKIFQ